jgi:inosine-uridine nucleoside N-ribohydrolase
VTSPDQLRPVLFDHDGGVDDLLSLIMLLAMPHIDLQGVVVTPADCFLRPAVSASRKILRFFDRPEIELSEGTLLGVNPFPRAWRAHAYAVDALPILNEIKTGEATRQPTDRSPDLKPGPGQFSVLKRLESKRGSLADLKERIQAKIMAELDLTSLAAAAGEAITRPVERLFSHGLEQENIILSRVERQRLFDEIMATVLTRLPGGAEPGHQFLARKLREANRPLTILMTGPVTNLAAALQAEPELAAKIEEVVWMGGALHVPGNVRDYEHDGSAEWNAYWDPPATHRLWQSQLPLTLFPLDATNHVPVTMDFLYRLAQQRRYPRSDLAGQCWALTVGTIPTAEYTYFMWDTLTTGYLGAAHCMTFREARTEVIPTGPSAGRIKEGAAGNKVIRVADRVDVPQFYAYLLELLQG